MITLPPDQFFNSDQQQRLGEIMTAWRQAHDVGAALPAAEQAELDHLTEIELYASARRAALLAGELGR